jgi:hypothetical protein
VIQAVALTPDPPQPYVYKQCASVLCKPLSRQLIVAMR